MEETIIELLDKRHEAALVELEEKYRGLCTKIATQILEVPEDAEECFNDALMKVWMSIPPDKPQNLTAYICRITRNLALDRYRQQHRKKRCTGTVDIIAQELADSTQSVDMGDRVALYDTLDRFMKSLTPHHRIVFVRRYWFFDSIRDIADITGESESSVKVILHRTRKKLARLLAEEEG